MIIMFKEVKIEVTHYVTGILCHLFQDTMNCTVEIHNIIVLAGDIQLQLCRLDN